MRVRYVSVSYRFGKSSTGLEQHYQELREAMVSAAQGYSYLRQTSAWRPPMDVHETAESVLVKVEVAGIREEDIEVELYPNALVITGVRRDDTDHDDGLCFHTAQVRYGIFHVDLALPAPIKPEDTEASYRDGFLRVRLPKVTPGAPRGAGDPTRATSEGAEIRRWQAGAIALHEKRM